MTEEKRKFMISLGLEESLPMPTFTGKKSAKLVMMGEPLPRNIKAELELRIAKDYLYGIDNKDQPLISNIRTNNPNDPPDVCFDVQNNTFGIELTELTLPNRLEINSIIKRLKESIISELPVGELTKDWVISVMLDTDDANKVNGRGLDKQIAQVVKDFLTSDNIKTDQYSWLYLPKKRGRLQLYKSDFSDDPRIRNVNEPLIVFSGLGVTMFPDNDIPEMVEKSLKSKFSIKTSDHISLLVWSEHIVLSSFDKEITDAIKEYGRDNPHSFINIIYVSLHNNIYYTINF